MIVNQKVGLRAQNGFSHGKNLVSLFREIKGAPYSFRLRPIQGNSLREINCFKPKCTSPLLERLRLKAPETIFYWEMWQRIEVALP